ncbi:DNA ATP-dependent helicase [Coprinopsis marcescibilis]|uniref:Chromatin-remodeling ATPase INO80 n=1 Tax=Coprinopsis marcescibilis TaxID=230819 RepID=A0A5C3LBX8_COPMA|nr:DNA ATP-dependent helicase [Coprinopsis marcescibilis]
MSLSRILNNDPAPQPGPSRYHPPPSATPAAADDDQPHSPNTVWDDPAHHTRQHPAPRPNRWSPDDSNPYDRYPIYPNNSMSVAHPQASDHVHGHDDTPDIRQHDHALDQPHLRKKRKGLFDDTDPHPSSSKRGKSRRRSPEFAPDTREYYARHIGSEEQYRHASSDLEGTEEIWMEDLNRYAFQTKKRQTQLSQHFWDDVLERNTRTAQGLSHQYSSRISNIPLRGSTPIQSHYRVPDQDTATPREYSRYTNGSNGFDAERSGYGKRHLQDTDFHNTAEDAAQELERSVLGDDGIAVSPPPHMGNASLKRKGAKPKDSKKRTAQDTERQSGSETEFKRGKKAEATSVATLAPPPAKKRKLNKAEIAASAAPTEAVNAEPAVLKSVSAPPAKRGTKGKGKAKTLPELEIAREPSQDSVSAPAKPRKKPGPKKKLGLAPEIESEIIAAAAASASTPTGSNDLGGLGSALPSYPPSVSGDATPSASRPSSPGPLSILYELEEEIPPLKKARKVDDASMLKRLKTLEEAQKKVWTNIAKRDVAKVYKYHTNGYQTRLSQLERTAKLASIQARKPYTKTTKANKDIQAKAKRLMREMQVFWKKNEKEERDVRRREQKEAMDRLKVEEEKREAARQARKLEFLISQTELYSHFVGNKLKTAEIEGENAQPELPAGADLDAIERSALPEIDFDNEDNTNLLLHAQANAHEAIAAAKHRVQQFDTQAALERKTNEALKLAQGQAHIRDNNDDLGGPSERAPLVDLDSDELNFQNPTSLSGSLTIAQPKMLMATLKEYQLKGLNWLATLYEQGINGILADEMGLGKTVQSISLLAYLAEAHDIWGPFLVVAPASTLHNWQQELTRFVPKLKALPYWGNVKDRATLRKVWNKKDLSCTEDAPFHVLITSYQLITQDQQYFQRIKWQYMILDEAQNIKNSSSVRWKTLLGFHCRNRLLLTGTPIQNSMQELWALLHFIMPSLFDSHDEFNEWFSKDIENAAENKGGRLNEHQLRRLHMILKPFMLRRVKRHVQNELSEKIEIDVFVDLSARQRALYAALRAKVSVQDLLEKAANMNDAESARSLMNLVMQFRKVCNHPELFERADVISPFSFCKFGKPAGPSRDGFFVLLPYSTRNPIDYEIPQLLYQDGGLLDVPSKASNSPQQSSVLTKLLNIWNTDWISNSIQSSHSSSFSFLYLLGMSPQEAHHLHVSTLLQRELLRFEHDIHLYETTPYCDSDFALASTQNPYQILTSPSLTLLDSGEGVPHLSEISTTVWNLSYLSKSAMKWYIPSVIAPPISMWCTARNFNQSQAYFKEAPLESLAIYGIPEYMRNSEEACAIYHRHFPALSPTGLIETSPPDQLPVPPMHVPEAKRLIYDSAKLARLDSLLQELKAGDHRVLVYFQMTRMMDLMEEYLIYRQYKYLRLDGSSKLEDRRDMVIDWQTRPDIFIFLLSTRAGGLGINLTAADTVIFYDHDWNPSNDAQAMDRAHRLGQTRQVTVYRLITKGTIDERIVQLARVKKDVQDIVVGNKTLTDITKPSEIVHLLLNDEQLASLDQSGLAASQVDKGKRVDKKDGDNMGDLWNDEGDDFFGSGVPAGGENTKGDEDNGSSTANVTAKKRKSKATGAPRGRRPGKKKAEATSTPNEHADV